MDLTLMCCQLCEGIDFQRPNKCGRIAFPILQAPYIRIPRCKAFQPLSLIRYSAYYLSDPILPAFRQTRLPNKTRIPLSLYSTLIKAY